MILETMELLNNTPSINDLEQKINSGIYNDILTHHSFLIMTTDGLVKVNQDKSINTNPIFNYVPMVGKSTITMPDNSFNDTVLTLHSGNENASFIGLRPKNATNYGYYGVLGTNPIYYHDSIGTEKILNYRDSNVYVYNIYAYGEGKSDNNASQYVSKTEITHAINGDTGALISAWNLNKFSLAAGEASHVEGTNCLALGKNSHAEGNGTIAEKSASHAEGTGSQALGKYSHAGGLETLASGIHSFAHGKYVKAIGNHSFSIGANDDENLNNASGDWSITMGYNVRSLADYAISIGDSCQAKQTHSIAIGDHVQSTNVNQFVIGKYNDLTDPSLFIIGNGTLNNRSNALSLSSNGDLTISGKISAITGTAKGLESFALGNKVTAYGSNSIAEGTSDHLASNYFTDTQIDTVITSAEKNSKSSTDNQNIQNFIDIWDHQDLQGDGDQKFALSAGRFSHTEGANSVALSKGGHAEGNGTIAGGKSAHSEGTGSKALGHYSHAGGLESEASGTASFAHGWRVKANGNWQTVLGKVNIPDNDKLLIIGNGNDDNDNRVESNAFTVDKNGNGEFAGTVKSDAVLLKVSNSNDLEITAEGISTIIDFMSDYTVEPVIEGVTEKISIKRYIPCFTYRIYAGNTALSNNPLPLNTPTVSAAGVFEANIVTIRFYDADNNETGRAELKNSTILGMKVGKFYLITEDTPNE